MKTLQFPEDEFAEQLEKVLSPSHAIQSLELLKGRTEQLDAIRRAWYQPGRQIFIHGFRGVGKTSLAQTAAFQRQSSDGKPILLTCDAKSTFNGIMTDLFSRAFPNDPRIVKEKLDRGLKAKLAILTVDARASIEKGGRAPTPTSLNEAVGICEFVAAMHSQTPVVVIDEFDQITDPDQQGLFALFVKDIADRRVPLRLIFCGIGESIDKFFAAHESTYRYFHTVALDRLGWEPRFEIVRAAADALGFRVDDHMITRIAMISDGFPHFIHLVCEKLFWILYELKNNTATPDNYVLAVQKAVAEIDSHLKVPYEKATKKYNNDAEEVLWAVADDHQLQRPSREIYDSYTRIMARHPKGKKALSQSQFHTRMNAFKNPTHGSILTGTRQGWYEFAEKMMRGYARLRASNQGIELEADHPLQEKRFTPAN